jgi:RHS repeat-associated protein
VQATDASGNVRTNVYQVTQTGPTKSFTYDLNGNLTGDGVKTYEWDAANRLTAVKQGGSTLASFTYDGNGRRATKAAGGSTTTYVYDGAQFLEERPSAGATKRHVYGPGIDQPLAQVSGGTATYTVADHLGSLVRATDAAGAPTLTREYDPWGSPLQGSATSGFAFTGREWDAEVQLAYYRARYYDPRLGRFLSRDRLSLQRRLLGGDESHDYVYVSNDPINHADPLGLLKGPPRLPPLPPGWSTPDPNPWEGQPPPPPHVPSLPRPPGGPPGWTTGTAAVVGTGVAVACVTVEAYCWSKVTPCFSFCDCMRSADSVCYWLSQFAGGCD